ncbi:SpoIID/LytB domain-containing protein [Cloacibacillus porcorum]
MKRYIVTLLFIFIFSQAAEARDVLVLLKGGARQCKIGGTSYVIRVASGGVTPAITGSFSLSYAGGGSLSAGAVSYAMPVTVTSSSLIIIDGVSYHGSILFEASGSGFNIVNQVDVEQYLKGVLKDEMSPAWPVEALKAQAVLARTYTLSSKKHGKYDLCAQVHCQSYSGVAGESPAIDEAVSATGGELLKYGGSVAQVFYYGDSGGFSASSRAVWGKDIPYLQARPDPVSYSSPNARWQTTLSMQQISSSLAAAGIQVGSISSIRPYSRDESGRVQQLEINGSGGRKLVTGNQFRLAVGAGVVKSTLFEFGAGTVYTPQATPPSAPQSTAQRSYPVITDRSTMPEKDVDKLYWMTQNKIFTVQELVSMIGKEKDYPKFIAEGEARMSGKKLPAAPVRQPAAQPVYNTAAGAPQLSMNGASGSSVTISGRGSGHGVGMPQWTAKALAEAGWSYRQILEYYFPGTALERGY